MIEPICPETEDAKLKDDVKFWKQLSNDTKDSMLTDLADLKSIGELVPHDVWIKLSDETKRKYYTEVLEIKRIQENSMPYKSNTLNFIFGHEELQENVGEAMSAMALICALLVGIPFSLMSILNGDFYELLKGTLAATHIAYLDSDPPNIYMNAKK